MTPPFLAEKIRVTSGSFRMAGSEPGTHDECMTDSGGTQQRPQAEGNDDMSHGAATEGPSPAGGAPAARRLVRRRDDKMLGGVASGLGDYFGIDAAIVRIAFVLVTFAAGTGVLAYLVAWWLIPEGDASTAGARGESGAPSLPGWAAAALVIVGGLVLLDGLDGFDGWDGSLLWGLALIGLGSLLLRRDEGGAPSGPGSAAAGGVHGGAATAPTPAAGSGGVTAAPARRPKERSNLGWFTVAAVLLSVGIAALLDGAGAVRLTAAQYLAVAVTVIGAGLLVGAVWGRARSLIALGLVLLPTLLLASVVPFHVEGGLGMVNASPAAADQIRDEYRLSAGDMRLDFSKVELGAEPVEVDASVGTGRIDVVVPRDARVIVDGKAGVGDIGLFKRFRGGLGIATTGTAGPEDGAGPLILHLQAGAGEITVRRDDPPPTGRAEDSQKSRTNDGEGRR